MSYIGTTKIGKMYLGNTEIAKAYLGTDLVFQKGGSPAIVPVLYEYLIFDGDSGIATNVPIPTNGSIRISLGNETTRAQQGVFHAGNSTEGYVRLYYGASTNNTKRNMVLVYDATSYIAYKDLNFSSSTYGFYMTPNGYGWGTAFYTYTKGNLHPTSGITFGSLSGTLRYTGRMGTIRIYGSDVANLNNYSDFLNYTPVATLVPCTYNGEAGLWHTESSTFYGKTLGNGTLTVSDPQ